MRVFRKLGLLPGMSGAQRRLLVEAALFLALARLAILVIPFRRIVPWLERSPDSPQRDAAAIAIVRQAVEIASRKAEMVLGDGPETVTAFDDPHRRGRRRRRRRSGPGGRLGGQVDGARVQCRVGWRCGRVEDLHDGGPGCGHG